MADEEEVIAYVDTNVLIEYRPLRDHPWLKTLGAKSARLVVCRDAFAELDAFKDRAGAARKKRQRAKATASGLEAILGDGTGPVSLQDRVSVEYDDEPLAREIIMACGLDAQLGDHRIVAAVLAARERHPTCRVCLVAADGGARRTALRQRLEAVPPDPLMKFDDEPDEAEVELRALRLKVKQMEARAPKLALHFADGESTLNHALRKARTDIEEHVGHQMDYLKQVTSPDGKPAELLALLKGRPSTQSLSAYEARRRAYLDAMRDLMPALIEHHNQCGLYVDIGKLLLENVGGAPAEDVLIILELPPHLDASHALPRGPDLPDLPPPPERGELGVGRLGRIVEQIAAIGPGLMSLDGKIEDPEHDWELTGGQIIARRRRLRHHQKEELGSFYVVLPSYDTKPFRIAYELHALNLDPPVQGELNVVLTQGDHLGRVRLHNEKKK